MDNRPPANYPKKSSAAGFAMWIIGVVLAGVGAAVFILGGWIAVILGLALILAGSTSIEASPWGRFLIFIAGLFVASAVALAGCSLWFRGL